MNPRPEPILRVEKGSPDGDELAALTVVLLARLAAAADAGPEAGGRLPRAGWRRPERAPGFQGPRTWHAAR
ncbi:acyl-CoA carboxylase subunit epsilon [Kitasatospora sp. NPDC092948]|uniref:acyl-CoA carboxylase subunit epsilon n=1 Tax=Kitasatospora sp. NPDC092948 TaxID=3364088 RepID=UPI00381E1AC0